MKTKKVYLPVRQAFTLIELLIVIAIIGILAGVVLVSTSSARLKAKDAAIIASTNSIMKIAQVDSVATGNYDNYESFSLPSTGTCNVSWSYIGTSKQVSVVAACNSILANQSGQTCGDAQCFWSSGKWGPIYPIFSLMVWLPQAQKYYCIGSNGGSSITDDKNWGSSGCGGDPTANGT